MILDLDYPLINQSAAKDVDSVSIRPENRVEYSISMTFLFHQDEMR
jgi:hypothetical protein